MGGTGTAHERRAYERTTSHVNNIHPEYANGAYNAQGIPRGPGLDLNVRQKGPRGNGGGSSPCERIQYGDEDARLFCIAPNSW